MYYERAAEDIVAELSEQFPAILVTGPRQVGKTTLLEKLSDQKRRYISLDVKRIRDLAKTDPELFIERYPPPVFIDEIQYAPELLPPIKAYIDRHKHSGDFWLTGSQMFQIMKDVSESLAGRVAIVQLQGLSLAEIKGWKSSPFNPEITTLDEIQSDRESVTVNDLFKQIFAGSFPYPLTKKVNRDAFFNSYVNTYIERDIRQLTQVADELSFYRFLTACAARTGTVVDYADIARDVEISAPTAKKWLSLLVSTGIVYLLDSYHSSALKRAIKAPKMYFMDTGLCAYLTRWDSPDSLEVGAMSGSIFESFVVGEIVKSYYNAGKRPPLSFYRDSNKVEIDLILEMNNTLYPNEIKKTGNPGRNAAKHLKAIEKAGKPVGKGNILCMIPEITPIDRTCFAVPVWII